MMGGGRMELTVDDGKGERVGSHIRLAGTAFGLELALDEVVTERTPPTRKVWETVGIPKLLVIGSYRMGFDITPQGGTSTLRVFIDYTLPSAGTARFLGTLLGDFYAKWCVDQMVRDTRAHFAAAGVGQARRAAA
jgi:hypothetical protein